MFGLRQYFGEKTPLQQTTSKDLFSSLFPNSSNLLTRPQAPANIAGSDWSCADLFTAKSDASKKMVGFNFCVRLCFGEA